MAADQTETRDGKVTYEAIKHQPMTKAEFREYFRQIAGDFPNQDMLDKAEYRLRANPNTSLSLIGNPVANLPTYEDWADQYLGCITEGIEF